MVRGFLQLPTELIHNILILLPLIDISHIRIQCTLLRDIVDDVLHLCYKKEIKAAALADAFPEHTPPLERLSKLRRREDAWTHFNPTTDSQKEVFIHTLSTHPSLFCHSYMYELNGGYFLVGMHSLHGDDAITAIYYIHIPPWDQSLAPVSDVPCTSDASETKSPRTVILDRVPEYFATNDIENHGSGATAFPSTEIQQYAETSGSASMFIDSDSAPGIVIDNEVMDCINWDATSPDDPEMQASEEELSDIINSGTADLDGATTTPDYGGAADKDSRCPEIVWKWFQFVVHPRESIRGFKLEIGLNLLVLVIRDLNDEFYLHLCEFPSAQPHPSVSRSSIYICSGIQDGCCIQVLGEMLGILLCMSEHDCNSSDEFFLYNWKSGSLLMKRTAYANKYHRFSFLSENVLVFPDESAWLIELCNISVTSHASDAKPPEALTSTLLLELPIFRNKISYWNFYCHTEPSHSSSLHNCHSAVSGSPFFTSPSTDGLIMFSVTADSLNIGCNYLKFVVHRRALLELLDLYISQGGQLEDSDDNSTRLSEDSDDDPSTESFESDDNNSSIHSRDGVISVPWSKWGPLRTYWFDTNTASLEYTQLVLGQRIIVIPPNPNPEDEYDDIHIYNFNPAAISAATPSDTDPDVVISLDPFILREDTEFPISSKRVFTKRVESQLPCVVSQAALECDHVYDVLVDGEIMIFLLDEFGTELSIIYMD